MLFVCYPKCTTCQKAKAWLEARGLPAEVRDIKTQNPTEAELRRVLSGCGYPACEKGAPGSNPLRNALKSALGRRPEG